MNSMEFESFILVGGRSSRMGRDKSKAALLGRPMVEWVSEAVTHAFAVRPITLVAGSPEQFRGAFGAGLSPKFVFDSYPDRGPLSGLHAALTNANTAWILAISCDLPLITAELLTVIASNLPNEDDVDAVILEQSDGRLQPLCGLYNRRCIASFEDILVSKRSIPSMGSVLAGLKTKIVKFAEIESLTGSENFFLNVNTAADLHIASEILRNRAG